MPKFLILFFLVVNFLFAQSEKTIAYKPKKNPYLASFLSIIPGLGHIYLGDGKTATQLFGSAFAFSVGLQNLTNKPGYISTSYRNVDFNFSDILNYQTLNDTYNNEKKHPVYFFSNYDIYIDEKGYFIYNEPEIQKKWRLFKNNQFYNFTLFELNPLLQYGPYNRFNTVTAKADNYSESLELLAYYSFYSSFRDAGGVKNKTNETFSDLASAPFKFRYLKDPKVWIPVAWIFTASFSQNVKFIRKFAFSNNLVEPEKVTLVNPGFHKSGAGHANTIFKSLSSGIGEEVFFRGFLYNGVSNYTGKTASSILVSTFFGSLHLYQGVWGALSATAFGLYTTYLYESYNQDLRPGIFLHFWWNTFVFTALMSRTYKEDPRVALNQREVNLSPVFYTYKF